MQIDFATIQGVISVGAVAIVPALTWFIRTEIRNSRQDTTDRIYKLELKVTEQMGQNNAQNAESVQIHRDMERRMSAIEDFHRNINSRLDQFQIHFKALLRKPNVGEGD